MLSVSDIRTRQLLGLPNWDLVTDWFIPVHPQPLEPLVRPRAAKQNKDIPVLANYDTEPHVSFWDVFPSHLLPTKPSTKVDIT